MGENKMKKIKVEFEVEIEGDQEWEFVRHGVPETGEYFLCKVNSGAYRPLQALFGQERSEFDYKIVKLIEPHFELETDNFLSSNNIDKVRWIRISLCGRNLFIDGTCLTSSAQSRDLAKIINYWAENGKLPDRVVVKGEIK